MLSPVSAVSALGTALEKPVVATPETSGVQTAATPLAVLSSTVNASVEGKLNMLLVAARERMFDSLLSAIDAASVALNASREPDENNAALAQRLADTIRSLPPQQLAVAQQLLDTQTEMPISLPVLAEALTNPDGPEAVQIAISLEAALTQEPDAVLKAVVNSYGQNAGETETAKPQTPVPAQTVLKTTDAAPMATSAASPASSDKAAAPASAAATAATAAQVPEETPAAAVRNQAVLFAAAILGPEISPDLETVSSQQAVPNQQSAPIPPAASALVVDTGLGEIVHPQNAIPTEANLSSAAVALLAASAEEHLPTEIALIRSPITPPPVPRDIQQIRADIKEGLQVVIGRAIDVAGPELLQIIQDDSTSAESVIAQALAANADDQKDVPSLPQTAGNEGTRNLAAAMASQNATSLDEMPNAPAALLGKSLSGPLVAPAPVMSDAAAQMGTPAPLPQGIPFAIAQYLPVDLPIDDEDLEKVNRVDPADDEEAEQGQGGEAPQDEGEDESQPEEMHHAPAEASDDAEAASSQDSVVAPKPLALPAPGLRDSLHDHAFDFYQRMVEWE
ncbi:MULTISPECIES: hypothetical protein [unclassified Rhizobium]|uniref:hypothetical protein n=1 Tax=unclassified Rhizobium TaxID=2613769 RepID=UPI000CDF42B6|nr:MULTISPECIES: hypothetical protein [Rhizobium]AVA19765.1 hypothetical protein NXC24_CH00081 [Rhizobium sp. NXC24]UWU21076.1 hypothetical protein N2601_17780 [Rhizobium tropici]